ncbi:hypothetical protein J2S43_007967 [Catenuloplanes nepalensis]|uniref:Uncharacterized protein n=1 Tax=Catenuloplanes nepalensis TaxID=587533 RepID=A0ABT9N7F5_9ACTN|nr:hypothetical protein [Catenuloplanes nepalensis]
MDLLPGLVAGTGLQCLRDEWRQSQFDGQRPQIMATKRLRKLSRGPRTPSAEHRGLESTFNGIEAKQEVTSMSAARTRLAEQIKTSSKSGDAHIDRHGGIVPETQ